MAAAAALPQRRQPLSVLSRATLAASYLAHSQHHQDGMNWPRKKKNRQFFKKTRIMTQCFSLRFPAISQSL